MDELLKEFLVESYENLDRLDRDFVTLETDPTASDKLASIFRTIHTIKGTSGCLGLTKLEAVAHVGENLLSRLRDGQLRMDSEITTGLLRLVDAIREILQSIEQTGVEGDADYTDVKQTLVALNARPAIGESPVAVATPAAAAIVTPAEHAALDLPHEPSAAPAIDALAVTAEVAVAASAFVEPHDAHAEPAAAAATKEPSGESVSGNAIRVDVGLLDKLMNLVGELVLARNQVLQLTADRQDVAFLGTAQRLNLITSELQEGVMKTRMQPIGNLWNKFPRIVRDVATVCGKKVRLEMEGKETELDKTIIEAIKDPLTHVIRNSVDHGVETPDKRLASGKGEEGRLFMRAFHEGGQVNIEISDDGKGIDPEVLKKKAVEKGLISADQAARLGERDAINLIFLPGFSTAAKVTNVSGRGVGMDVVKTNIEKIGGTVDVKSKVGAGTTLRIKIPLTLAIIPALVVTSGGQRFAIPQVSLLELVRLDAGTNAVEMINGTPVYRLRGNLLPLAYLNHELRLDGIAAESRVRTASTIVVLRCGERQFGLVVDQVNDTEEIVVKPLGKQLKSISVFAGATIMGDGKVALILDVMGIAQAANILSHNGEGQTRVAAKVESTDRSDRQMLLLCQLASGGRLAIPLSAVARLEEFAWSGVETAGGEDVVQYRGEIMPLVDVEANLNNTRRRRRRVPPAGNTSAPTKFAVVVYAQDGRNVGLRIDEIIDVIDERVVPQQTAARPGVVGTVVLKDRVCELLDIDNFVRAATARRDAIAA